MKTPIYQVIQTYLKNQIHSGELKHMDMIMSENELKGLFNVSRMTVRQALNNLVNEGYLYRQKGKGTFVKKQVDMNLIDGIQGFTEQMNQLGRVVSNRLISFDIVPSNSVISEKLFLKENTDVYTVQRVRYGDKIPIAVEKLYIPKKLFKSLDTNVFKHSFYQHVKELNFQMSHFTQTIKAIKADQRISDYLEIPQFSPILYTTKITYLTQGFPFEYVETFYRSDQYEIKQHVEHKAQ
ncbi:MAG: GntR family transcriptional regulator [Acholeplasmataceae bacterium]